jgi:hypothetical protein
MIRMLVVSVGLMAAWTLAGAVCAEAQSQQDVDQGSTADSVAARAKTKKVWTNDNMGDVTGAISIVGTAQQKPTATPSKISSLQVAVPTGKTGPGKSTDAKSSDGSIDPKTLAQVRAQLQKLQTSIDQLDKQIDELKGANRGDSKNLGMLTSDPSRYSTAPVPDQIKTLEAKKSWLQAAMDNLLDVARAIGIEPGQLR